MNFQGLPEQLAELGTTETFERIDPNSKEGRRRSERTLLRSQPNSLRDKLMDLPSLADEPLPEIEFAVAGWVPMRAATMCAGLGGGGKTTMIMQMGACVSLGRPWFGLETRKMKALCLLTEDERNICHIRSHHIAKGMGLTLRDLPDFKPLPIVQSDTALMTIDQFTREAKLTHVYSEVRALCIENDFRFIGLDALHGLFEGNENDRYSARRFCTQITELAQELNGAAVILAHPSKSSGQDTKNPLSGSTSWHGGVRSVIHVSDPDDLNPDARTIRLAKANYGRVGEKIEVTWRDGVFWHDAEPTGVFKHIAGNRAERVMFEGLQKAVMLGYEPCLSDRARDQYAAKIVASQWGQGLKLAELAKAMGRLIQDGKLKVIKVGPPSKVKTLVVPATMITKFPGAEVSNCGNSDSTDNVRSMSEVSEGAETERRDA